MNRTRALRALVAALLALALAAGPCAALAENAEKDVKPELEIDVWYIRRTDAGSFDCCMAIGWQSGSGRCRVDRLENLRVTAEGTNGLTPKQRLVELGTVDGTRELSIHFDYADPDGSRHPAGQTPEVILHVSTANCGSLDYACEVDVQPRARVIGLRPESADNVEDMNLALLSFLGAYEGRSYDGADISWVMDYTTEKTPKKSALDALREMVDPLTDENDITYVYICTHGLRNQEWEITDYMELYQPGDKVDKVTYGQVLDWAETIPGRVVVVFDCCFSGRGIAAARDKGLDTEKFAVISATDEATNELTGDNNEGTELRTFLNKLRKRGEKASAQASTVGDLKAYADDLWRVLGSSLFKKMGQLGQETAFLLWLVESDLEYKIERVEDIAQLFEVKDASGLKETVTSLWEHAYFRQLLVNICFGLELPQFHDLSSIQKLWEDAVKAYDYSANTDHSLTQFLLSFLGSLFSPDCPTVFNKFLEGMSHTLVHTFIPQVYGNEELPLFFYDDDWDDGYRFPVPMTSKEDVRCDATPPRLVGGVALDAQTQAPVAGAKASFASLATGAVMTAETDENGEWLLLLDVAERAEDTALTFTAAGYAETPHALPPGQADSLGEVVLMQPEAGASGLAVDCALESFEEHCFKGWYAEPSLLGEESEALARMREALDEDNRANRAALEKATTYARANVGEAEAWEDSFMVVRYLQDVYADDAVLSLLSTFMSYELYASFGDSHRFNFDLQTGEELELTDVLEPDNADAWNALRDRLAEGLARYGADLTDSPRSAAEAIMKGEEPGATWFFTPDGLRFNTSPEGRLNTNQEMNVTVAWASLEGVVKAKYIPTPSAADGRCDYGLVGELPPGSYDVYRGEGVDFPCPAVAVVGEVSQLTVWYKDEWSWQTNRVLFYAPGLSNACVFLPEASERELRVTWTSGGEPHELELGVG